MPIDVQLTYTFGTASMAIGTVALLVGLRHFADERPLRYLALAGVTGIATVAYAAMTLGIGVIPVDGQPVFVPRYIDWLLTTPLLLVYVGLLAGASRRVLAGAIGLDAVVITLGFASTLLSGTAKYAAFWVATLAFLGVMYLLWRPVSAAARECSTRDAALFEKLRNVIGVLWLLYPVIWLASPVGVGLMGTPTTALIVVYLDVLTKVVFGAIVLNDRGAFLTLDRDATAASGAADAR